MKIEMLGSCCAKCSEVERIVREAVAESGKAVEVEKVTECRNS